MKKLFFVSYKKSIIGNAGPIILMGGMFLAYSKDGRTSLFSRNKPFPKNKGDRGWPVCKPVQ